MHITIMRVNVIYNFDSFYSEVIEMATRKKGIFYSPPRHKKLAAIVTFESVTAAEKAARELAKMFRDAKRRDTKRTIKRAVVLAATRARIAARRRDLSPAEKAKLHRIAAVYAAAAARMVMPRKRRR